MGRLIWVMRLAMLLAVLFSMVALWMSCEEIEAAPKTFDFTAPCYDAGPVHPDTACGFQADSDTMLGTFNSTPLKEVRFVVVQLGALDTLHLVMPAVDRQCDSLTVTFDFQDGHCYEIWALGVDMADNVSCWGNHHVFCIQKAEFTPGLDAYYYNDRTFTSLVLNRTDPRIFFNWSTGTPAPEITGDAFSARWIGKLRAPLSGTYGFRLLVNDAGRMQLGATTVFDDLATGDGEHSVSGAMSLSAGVDYDLVVEMFERQGSARAELYWTQPGLAEEVVPTTAFTQ